MTEEKAERLIEAARTSVARRQDEDTGLALSLMAEDLLRLEKRIGRLKPRHAQYIEAVRQGEPHIDEDAIAGRLAELEYPLYFFDFETVSPPIPHYKGTRPWQQVPFQYSVHVLREDGHLDHAGYLHDEDGDSRSPLVEKMLRDLDGAGSVIAYHASFEKNRLKELQETFPQHAGDGRDSPSA